MVRRRKRSRRQQCPDQQSHRRRQQHQPQQEHCHAEEPEPEDGWDSYGSYVANNVNVPENFEKRKTGGIDENSVEVSFEVTRDGNPVNFKVEKSLCDQCDKEAVRLIKEGPKWKRKNRKSKKTTISIPFR